MLGKICIQAFVIGVLSTGIYMIFTKSENRGYDPHYQKTRTNECLCIGGIVFGVSVLMLRMTNKSAPIALRDIAEPKTLNHKPPF